MQIYDIIIMEDDEDLGQMITIMLSLPAYRLNHITNSQLLKEAIAKSSPQLIIMDMLLSGADGTVICKELKQNETSKGIMILLMSAHPEAREASLSAGADAFLQKPFEMSELRETVKQLLGA